MPEQSYNDNFSEVNGGIWMDSDPINQPSGTRRFTLNAIDENSNESERVYNEGSALTCTTFPAGYIPIGNKYIQDNTIFVILVNPVLDRVDIGLIDSNNIYGSLVNTGVLTMKVTNQCQIEYRLRRDNVRVFYWVDGLNVARSLNIDSLYLYYSTDYQTYIRNGGNPNTYIGDKWNLLAFNLIKTYSSIPTFNSVTIIESGNILPGSYNFAIRYLDANLNPTNWITTSNTVNIYNDSELNNFASIRGSKNVTNSYQSFPRTSKSVQLAIGNLDSNFPFYNVGIIRCSNTTGVPDALLISELNSTNESNYIYTGNDASLTSGSIADILIDNEIIFAPQHIAQLENRCLLSNTQDKQINWCQFQAFASKISTDLTTQDVILNDIDSDANVKSANSTFRSKGYLPGEVYSFGICYIFKDGTISPVFHIPGKNSLNTTSRMVYHQIDEIYLDIHNCSSNNYWGRDAYNYTLLGKNIRHHRFPFRKDVDLPLVTTTNTTINITRYNLSLVISLNPAWTPGPPSYPLDGSGNPIPINYIFDFLVSGAGGNTSISGILTDTDVSGSNVITLYDDTLALSYISGTDYVELDTTSELYTVYNPSTNNRFIITPTYKTYNLASSSNADVSEIMGIEFNNIINPLPDQIVGFYIVRNDRTDNDKIVIDNAIFGPMTSYGQFRAFATIMPKQFYNTYTAYRSLGNVFPVPSNYNGAPLVYDENTVWFFNPNYQYLNNNLEFDGVEVEGKYQQNTSAASTGTYAGTVPEDGYSQMPTIGNMPLGNVTAPWNNGGSQGVYITDVQPGTTYNPAIDQKKNDTDLGFDLLVGYRNNSVTFSLNSEITFPAKDRDMYITAANNINYGANTYYNASVDNKIGMYLSNDNFDTSVFYDTDTKLNSLVYGSLTKNNTSSYSDFIDRNYYKEHNNPILFNDSNIINDLEIFNGDASISSFNFISTVYYDVVVANRPKKTSLWDYIVGAILIVAAVVVEVVTLGSGTALAALAISYGVSLIVSGLKLNALESMTNTDYNLGLRNCIYEGGMFQCINPILETEDDTIRWFSDRVSNIYMESSVPFGIRDGCTNGTTDFIDAPTSYSEPTFRTYITNKLTVVDPNQQQGRLYKGYTSAEFYDINLDYMRNNQQKIFQHLAIDYDCCAEYLGLYPTRIWNSNQTFQEEETDGYGIFLPNNYIDIEGQYGEITNMYVLGNNLFIHTKEGLWQLPQNNQERVTNEIVTFIGTGSIFALMPRKVVDNSPGTGGSINKWATIKTPMGVFFVSEVDRAMFIHGDGLKNISIRGLKSYSYKNIKPFLSDQLYDNFNLVYPNNNNPANPSGIGYLAAYDKRHERILVTKRDYLITPTKIGSLTIINGTPLPTVTGFMYDSIGGVFYLNGSPIPFTNTQYFINKSFTLSYSLLKGGKWSSWHSYIPMSYIYNQSSLYSYIFPDSINNILSNFLWKHNSETSFGIYYNSVCAFIIEGVKKIKDTIENYQRNRNTADNLTQDLSFYTEARVWDITRGRWYDNRDITFNKVTLSNTRQCTGEVVIVPKNVYNNPVNYLSNQTIDVSNVLLLSRRDRNWNLNGFRDYIDNYTMAMFSEAWEDISNNYFIDGVVNSLAINPNKNWYELEPFKDKYLLFRLKFDNFSNINLIVDFSTFTDQQDI